MPTPTHSGSRQRIGLASSAVWATDRVIGGRISRCFPGGSKRQIEARQGIILGKSACPTREQNPRESRVLATSLPARCNNQGVSRRPTAQIALAEAIFDETPVAARVARRHRRAAFSGNRASPARPI